MARKNNVLPSYLLYSQSGQARTRIDGRDHLLAPYRSEESRIRYAQLIAQVAGGLPVDPLGGGSNRGSLPRNESEADSGPSVAELLLAFKTHAEAYYVKGGKKTAEVNCFASAIRPVRKLFAMLPAPDFGPLHLKAVQVRFVDEGWSRGFSNKSTNRVRHVWKWGVGNGLVPVATWQALTAVPPLKAGHTTAPDHKRREAVSDEHIEAVRPHLAQHLRDLFGLLRATGAWPSELLGLSMADINTTGEIWIADLTDHKNAHRGLSRKLFFCPKSQLILRRLPATGPLLSIARTYFSEVLKRACIEAKVPPFVPYALRHAKATELRDTMSIEAAKACG
jgi:integrase